MIRVLIVDNEPSTRLTLRDYLPAGEFEVHEAADVDQGLRILLEKPIDVVVSEIELPRVRGLELLHQLRYARPTVRIILISGQSSMDLAIEGLRQGAFDYFVKPIDQESIVRAVRNAAFVKALDEESLRDAENSRKRLARLEQQVQQSTQALRESEERYCLLALNSPDLIMLTTADGFISYLSPQSMKVIGHDAEDLLGRAFPIFLHPEDKDRVEAAWTRVLAEEKMEDQEYRMLGANQEVHWVFHRTFPVRIGGKIRAIQHILRDVAITRIARQALQLAQENLRYALPREL